MSENQSENCSELCMRSPVIMRSPESSGQIIRQADSDEQLIALWIHRRPKHTQRAYRREAQRFMAFADKPLRSVKLLDLQVFADHLSERLKESSVHRSLSAV